MASSPQAYEVFRAQTVIDSLPLRIESLATYHNRLLVGSDDGSILVYTIEDEPEFSINLVQVLQGFAKKSIDQIVPIPELGCCWVLSDGAASVYELGTLSLIAPLPSARGCSLVSIWSPPTVDRGTSEPLSRLSTGLVQSPRDLASVGLEEASFAPPSTSEPGRFKACVVVKKRLILMEYDRRSRSWLEVQSLATADRVRSMMWIDGDKIVAALPKSFVFINLQTGATADISLQVGTAGRNNRPAMVRISDNTILAYNSEGSKTIFINLDGTGPPISFLEWSAYPEELFFSSPYAIALTSVGIEVKSTKSGRAVQTLDSSTGCRHLAIGDSIYVASSTSVWRLFMVDFEDQIEDLIVLGKHQAAEQLIEDLEFASPEEKKANIVRVRALHAYHMFAVEKKYKEAIEILEQLDASPIDVINLFPDLAVVDPDDEPTETAPESDPKALEILVIYLTGQRNILSELKNNLEGRYAVVSEPRRKDSLRAELEETLYLMQLVDTTLLKVYLAINDGMVGPLMNVTNSCDVEITETLLRDAKKLKALLDFYRSRGMHQRAMEYLTAEIQSDDPQVKLRMCSELVEYLQRIKFDQLDLILEYSLLVIQNAPALVASIFVDRFDEVTLAQASKILIHLDHHSPESSLPFLKHIVTDMDMRSKDLHNRLALGYFNQLALLRKRAADQENHDQTLAASESNECEKDLVEFLEKSDLYAPELILRRIPDDDFFEERAILFRKLKRYPEVLKIYVEKLKKYSAAEAFCEKYYNSHDEHSREVFHHLMMLYIGLTSRGEMDMEDVVQYVKKYAPYLHVEEVLKVLPESLNLAEMMGYFSKALQSVYEACHASQIVKNVHLADRLQIQEQLSYYQSGKVYIDDDKMCQSCLKKISGSVFARYPDGLVVHVYCAREAVSE
ncbi:vacuolar sorting protein 39 domain 2-domain-containing protein [Polychytrium aggregatum]|uniref:vacuolar sorting protein 39 domain 2-domain-containing protein n=1 Tax=Polychytrium aggregatum TaxID=110093 RepID=UPI0022FEE5DD|nr:vacuolar sorting protein 39 domain 2-domain-containing protein [Polychytrium aggregatum]KAI9202891.1 vacuolar sorting protein 39 domain 2-domain-containing protein [Polychytrium aggregatum]